MNKEKWYEDIYTYGYQQGLYKKFLLNETPLTIEKCQELSEEDQEILDKLLMFIYKKGDLFKQKLKESL